MCWVVRCLFVCLPATVAVMCSFSVSYFPTGAPGRLSPMATDTLATVLADLQFCTANGATVCMRASEQVLVLEKTNDKWWKVSAYTYQDRRFKMPISVSSVVCILIGYLLLSTWCYPTPFAMIRRSLAKWCDVASLHKCSFLHEWGWMAQFCFEWF